MCTGSARGCSQQKKTHLVDTTYNVFIWQKKRWLSLERCINKKLHVDLVTMTTIAWKHITTKGLVPRKERQWRYKCLSEKFKNFNLEHSERLHKKRSKLRYQRWFPAAPCVVAFMQWQLEKAAGAQREKKLCGHTPISLNLWETLDVIKCPKNVKIHHWIDWLDAFIITVMKHIPSASSARAQRRFVEGGTWAIIQFHVHTAIAGKGTDTYTT